MPIRAVTVAAMLVASAFVAACATPAPGTAEDRPEAVYRTGSNIPVKDGSASRVLTARPDDTPRAPGMPMPRAGGGG